MSFRLGMEGAENLAKEFYPEFAPVDLVSLPKYNIYLKLVAGGALTKRFSAETFSLSECWRAPSLARTKLCLIPAAR